MKGCEKMSEEQQLIDVKVKVDHSEVEQLGEVTKKSAKNINKQTNKAFNQLGPMARKSIEVVSKQMNAKRKNQMEKGTEIE